MHFSFIVEGMRSIIFLALVCTASACGGKDTPTAPTPTSPTPPPVTASPLPPSEQILGFSIYGDQWVYLGGQGQQYTVRIDLKSGGTPIYDTDNVTWSVEPASIATIDAHGKLTPIASGDATVRARAGNTAGDSRIRVLPDYAGEWSGEFVITGCSGGHDFRECGRLQHGLVGTGGLARYPFVASLSKFRGDVTGSIHEPRPNGDLSYPVSGFVRVSGELVLEATAPLPNQQEPLRVFNWSSVLAGGVGAMSGAFTKVEPHRTNFGDPYTIRSEHEFSGLSRAR
jgi:hypothetical protein